MLFVKYSVCRIMIIAVFSSLSFNLMFFMAYYFSQELKTLNTERKL
jgi:hypothetical protein